MVGQVNMVSHRNVDTKTEYKLLRYYAGAGDHEMKKSRAASLDEAVDNAVMAVPGGEFLKNARFYKIDKKYWGAAGDVWGNEVSMADISGFKVGDIVYYRPKKNKSRKATILAIKNATVYLIQLEQTGRKLEASPGELYLIEPTK